MQNDWILLDQNLITNKANATTLALKTFNTYLGDAYALPDSAVFLFQKTNEDAWTIWNGFRASKSGPIKAFEIGTTSAGHLSASDLNDRRRDFGGITLRANTVVCAYTYE